MERFRRSIIQPFLIAQDRDLYLQRLRPMRKSSEFEVFEGTEYPQIPQIRHLLTPWLSSKLYLFPGTGVALLGMALDF